MSTVLRRAMAHTVQIIVGCVCVCVCVVKSDEKDLKLSEDPSWFLLISKALYSYHWILRDRVLWKAFPDPRLLG